MIQNEIYEQFEIWMNDLLEQNTMPEDTAAFCFNLYDESEDDGEHIYGVQLIASDRFDSEDGDWPCDEVWSSGEDIFCIDTSDEKDTGWQRAQDLVGEMVKEYLENGTHRRILQNTKAVGIGFVDGELDLIWQAEK